MEAYNGKIRHYVESTQRKKMLFKIKNYSRKIIAFVDAKIKQSEMFFSLIMHF
jgi:hypothetical protein